jgi:phosphoribosyl-ATP pyrophosphohydrolase
MLVKVEEFNTTVRLQAIPSSPRPLTIEQADRASEAVKEELDELHAACRSEDVLEAADAIIDMMFFGLGRLAEMGVPANAVFEAVTAANLLKVPGTKDTRPTWTGADAVKPPEGWTPPDHSWLLDFSLADVAKARAYDEMSPVFKRLTELRARKGADYNNVPGGRDAYFPFGHMSYAHMLNTKGLRVQSLVASMLAGKAPNFEGLEDSVVDLINYATYYAEAMADDRITATGSRVAA